MVADWGLLVSTVYEVPLSNGAQSFTLPINGAVYGFRLIFADIEEGGWLLDISDASGTPLVSSIPLVTGADLLEQYAHLGIGVKLYVVTDGAPYAPPTFDALGVSSHLYFEAP